MQSEDEQIVKEFDDDAKSLGGDSGYSRDDFEEFKNDG